MIGQFDASSKSQSATGQLGILQPTTGKSGAPQIGQSLTDQLGNPGPIDLIGSWTETKHLTKGKPIQLIGPPPWRKGVAVSERWSGMPANSRLPPHSSVSADIGSRRAVRHAGPSPARRAEKSGSRGTRADQGVRPTSGAACSARPRAALLPVALLQRFWHRILVGLRRGVVAPQPDRMAAYPVAPPVLPRAFRIP
jgi:hypothetical protein